MKVFQLTVLMLFTSIFAFGQNNDGTIIEKTDCPPKTVTTYDQYIESAKKGFAVEIEKLKKNGIKIEMPTDFSKSLLSREDFERRQSYTGIACRRIKYMSDGLKIVGYTWQPKNGDQKNARSLSLIAEEIRKGANSRRGWLTDFMSSFQTGLSLLPRSTAASTAPKEKRNTAERTSTMC